jgi:hypothetical protein
MELFILGEIHLAHSALTEFGTDLIAAESGARS